MPFAGFDDFNEENDGVESDNFGIINQDYLGGYSYDHYLCDEQEHLISIYKNGIPIEETHDEQLVRQSDEIRHYHHLLWRGLGNFYANLLGRHSFLNNISFFLKADVQTQYDNTHKLMLLSHNANDSFLVQSLINEYLHSEDCRTSFLLKLGKDMLQKSSHKQDTKPVVFLLLQTCLNYPFVAYLHIQRRNTNTLWMVN